MITMLEPSRDLGKSSPGASVMKDNSATGTNSIRIFQENLSSKNNPSKSPVEAVTPPSLQKTTSCSSLAVVVKVRLASKTKT